ncbi:CwfJ C-terminus 2-domain-containing protein-like protein [Aspergillus ambiguus]|uniref:CwfJ domain protein n=1 Tax=Aspergillus ambiguus TaxID=176160 RepID=UPI003CCCC324
MASKIVVLGDVNGQFRDVFTKLAKLHVKQSFSFAIVAGDLFGDCSTEHELDEITALLQQNTTVPLPTYFTLGSRPLPTRVIEQLETHDEVCPNLYFLGRRGTLKTSEGIRLVALGGTLDAAAKQPIDKYHPTYTESDARALHGAHSADILITHQWPKDIRFRSNVPIPEDAAPPADIRCIADLVSTLKPRYHLSSSAGFFYEREPFFHLPSDDHHPDAKPLTRFISLAAYNNPSKQKSMYAFTLDPTAAPALSVPAGTTASPLPSLAPKRKPPQHEPNHRFAIDESADHTRPRKRARAPPPGPDQCFFCLSNPNIATHLITSIGNESYLTTAKGPLPTSTTFPALGFPGHMLIIPFTHAPTLASITDDASRRATYAEMQRYRAALHAMLARRTKGKGPDAALGAVTWEVSRANGIHLHWQVLPVAADMVARGLVEAAFRVEAENLKYPKFETVAEADAGDASAEPGDYFRVWIWRPADGEDDGAETEKTLLLPLGPEFRFDLQFGRRVMAKLMELEKRINWKNDVQSQEEEEADATAFKEAFKDFDFTME